MVLRITNSITFQLVNTFQKKGIAILSNLELRMEGFNSQNPLGMMKVICRHTVGWSELMSNTMEKQRKIYKKHCFCYMKKFIPWRYVLLYLCESWIFSDFICYIDHFINKKDQKILPSEVDQVMLFLCFQKRHQIHARPCFRFCAITLEDFVMTTWPRHFWKEEWWCFSTLPFSLRVYGKAGCSQVKNFI